MKQAITGAKIFSDHKLLDNKALLIDGENIIGIVDKIKINKTMWPGLAGYSLSAHKFHGPKGVGLAFVRKNSGLKPLIYGGSQERGLRAGTEGVHNIVGLATALEYAYNNLEQEKEYIQGIKDYFAGRVVEEIPSVKLNGNCSDAEKSYWRN